MHQTTGKPSGGKSNDLGTVIAIRIRQSADIAFSDGLNDYQWEARTAYGIVYPEREEHI